MSPVRLFAAILLSVGAMTLAIGCGPERHPDIPADAMLGVSGDGLLTYRSPSSGMVYVYDDDTNKMIYAGKVLSGQTIRVDPARDRVTIGDQTVYDKDLNNGNTHKVFFERESILER